MSMKPTNASGKFKKWKLHSFKFENKTVYDKNENFQLF